MVESHIEISDEEILARIADGEQEALQELYQRWSSSLLGIALKFMRSRPEAEDITHDVLLEIWKTAASYDPDRGAARTWIVMKMRSRVIDRLRKGKRRATLLLESQDTLTPTHISEDPGLTLERRQLRETIKTLSEHQQEVIELTYFEHMTAVEVGEELGIPTGTVKSRLAAARRALKELLTHDEGGTPE